MQPIITIFVEKSRVTLYFDGPFWTCC